MISVIVVMNVKIVLLNAILAKANVCVPGGIQRVMVDAVSVQVTIFLYNKSCAIAYLCYVPKQIIARRSFFSIFSCQCNTIVAYNTQMS